MIGLYIFLTLTSYFSSDSAWTGAYSEPAQIVVDFQSAEGVELGGAVIAGNKEIGAISKIDEIDNRFVVELSIAPQYKQLLRDGTIALISSTVKPNDKSVVSEVKLMIPELTELPALASGDTITGYSSFEDFWSADRLNDSLFQSS